MSILSRLVARANGTATPGLRTRLPSHFEAGNSAAQEGFFTVQEDVPARPTPEPHSPPVAEAPQHRQQDTPRAEPPPGEHNLHNPEPPAPLQPPAQKADTQMAEPTVLPTEAPKVPSSGQNQTPQPLLPETPPSEVHITHLEQAASEPERQPIARIETSAPEPLLPADKATVVEHIPHAVAATAPKQHSQAPLSTAEPNPPEITIHIGRIDLRSDAPRPAQSRTPAKRPTLPSLSDYLKGSVS